MSKALVLFTRDLRVRDHAALSAAVREHDAVVPAFVLDSELLRGGCGAPNRLAFLFDCLRDLDRSLGERGTRLLVRHGDVVHEALELAHRWDLTAIYMSHDVTPYARARQQRLVEACRAERIELRTFPGVTVVEAGEITPVGGDHYRVFTPYWRVWSALPVGATLRAPRRIAGPAGEQRRALALPKLASLTSASPSPRLQPGGESVARTQLERWLRSPIDRYGANHDDLAAAATSGLSAHLHFGCISPRTVLARSHGHGAGGEDFARQLCWRDFHHQVLAARPDLPHADYRSRGDRWRRDALSSEAWRQGLTGYPIVDAGMRQLAHEGFMHNRARLIVASFLTKLLYVDWRTGAAHFARLLIDADVANNVGNWQWVAGTGNDTRPNRVLNPMRQAQRFDPHGDYVRRHVPELASIPGRAVHEPWLLGSKRARIDYPEPLVDHLAAAAELRAHRYGSNLPA